MNTTADKRPNILIVIVHDLGARLGCYGESSVHSPNLDALAAEGVCFRRHFATACFCSPSRGAIFTGKHPHVNGLMGLTNLDWDLPEGNRTLAQLLGERGYETFLFGHQHEVKHVEQLGEYVPNKMIFAEKNTQPKDIKRCIRTKRYKYIRNYDDGPKLFLPSDIEMSLTRRDMGDEHHGPRSPVELYDLDADPNEMSNLAGRPETAGAEAELASTLQRFLEETNDPIVRGGVPRPPGEAEVFRKLMERVRAQRAT